jgi:hypothetical protein
MEQYWYIAEGKNMAVCKDCGAQVGFMKKRCATCQEKFDAEQKVLAEQKAAEAVAAAEKRAIDGEEAAFANAKSALGTTFDKFEGRSEIVSPTFKVNAAQFDALHTGEKMWHLRIVHKPTDWQWLGDNRTIILFADGSKLVQEHGGLVDTEVTTDIWDNVVCQEEHHVNIAEAIPYFVSHYETHKYGAHPAVQMRIGRLEYPLSFEFVRSVAAMAAVAAAN